MILARMLSYIKKRKWNVLQVNNQRVLVVSKADSSWFVDVTKHADNTVDVTLPVRDLRCKMVFGSDMHAYEYLEDLMLDNDELINTKVEEGGNNKLYNKKRKSLDTNDYKRLVRQRTYSS